MPTYPLDLPDVEFVSARLRIVRASTVVRSPFTGKTQAGELPFSLWALRFQLPVLDEEEARDWKVFVAQLHGQFGTFKAKIPGYTGPTTGYAGAQGLVNGADQTGLSLVTDTWANSSSLFHKGNWFTVNDELKMITADVSSNGSGAATLAFEPALRESPANNAPITFLDPYCIMSPVSDDSGWDIDAPELYSFAFEAAERF